MPRVVDFGIAKAATRLHTTQDGKVKGKFAYMAPEQLNRAPVDRRADLWAAGVIAWELVAQRRLFEGEEPSAVVTAVLYGDIPHLLERADVPGALDDCIRVALSRDVEGRFRTAREFHDAIHEIVSPASSHALAEWVQQWCGSEIGVRSHRINELESESSRPARPVAKGEIARLIADESRNRRTSSKTVPTEGDRGRSRALWAALAIAAAAGAGGVAAKRLLDPPTPTVPSVAVSAASSTIALASASNVTPPVSASIPSGSSAPTVAVRPTSTSSAVRTPPRVTVVHPPSSATPPATTSPACDPPTIVGVDGILRVKPGCN